MKDCGMKKIPIVFWEEHKVQSPVPVRIRVIDKARWRFGLGRVLRTVCLLLTAFRLS
jgi:hypothetical protein